MRYREVKLSLRLKARKVNVYPRKDLSAKKKHKTQGLSLVVAEEIACVDCQTGVSIGFRDKTSTMVAFDKLTNRESSAGRESSRILCFVMANQETSLQLKVRSIKCAKASI